MIDRQTRIRHFCLGALFWLACIALAALILRAAEPKPLADPLRPLFVQHTSASATDESSPDDAKTPPVFIPVQTSVRTQTMLQHGVTVQIASYRKSRRDLADNMRVVLEKDGQPAYIDSIDNLLVLRAGPFVDTAAADVFIAWLRAQHAIDDAYVVRRSAPETSKR